MDQKSDAAEPFDEAHHGEVVIRPISEWIWKPWYAKLWWALIPIYWSGAAMANSWPAIETFYSSALAGFVNVFMVPPTALVVLAAGFLRQWTNHIDWSTLESIDNDLLFSCERGPSGRPYYIDPLDPRSGAFWVGSPANPQSPFNPANQDHRG